MHNRNYTEQDAIQRLLLFEEGLSGIIGLMKEEKKDVSKDDMDFLCQSLTQDVCRKCPKYRECYGVKQKETIGEIASILEQAYQCSGAIYGGNLLAVPPHLSKYLLGTAI